VPGESLNFPIFAEDRASKSFREVGRSALDASGKIDIAAASLKLFDATSIKAGKAADTSTAAMKTHRAAALLLADTENVLAGKATVATKLMADQGRELDNAAKKAKNAASGLGLLSNTAGLTTTGLGALAGVGVALSPVIATLGVGFGGLALAAMAAGKNSKQLAAELAPLKADFAGFGKELQPVVVADFAAAIGVARTALHGIEPVAAATGKALGGVFAEVDATLRSPAWTQFFGFMAREAGPDIALLGKSFTTLMMALPPLLEQLQPTATAFLEITLDVSRLLKAMADLNNSSDSTGQHMNALQHITADLRTVLFSPGAGLLAALKLLHLDGGNVSKDFAQAAKDLQGFGGAAGTSKSKVWNLNTAVAALNTSMTTLVGNLLTLQGSDVSWKQAMQAATAQLHSNSAGLAGNSKNALANKQAVLQVTNAAISFAEQQLTLGKNIGGASRTVQAQIRFLQGLHDKSKFVQDEIAALRKEEARLQAQRMNQQLTVHGKGTWSVVGTGPFAGKPTGFAAGWRVPGFGGGDRWPALLEGGEAVVPKHLTPALAPFLKAHGVPGFAAGGIVPSYSGAVGGVWPWVKHNDAATITLIDRAVVAAAVAGMHAAARAAAAAGAGGPASGAVRALQQYAASLFGQFGWGMSQLGPLIALWNGESGWNPRARNPSSGAFGIPQALPPGKMGALAASGNAAAQIRWGEGYIHGVYGTPANAYGMWLSRSPHWYGKGTRSAFPGFAVVGERGPELVNFRGGESVTPARGGRGGPLFVIEHADIRDPVDLQLLAQKTSFAVVAASLGS
jgi:hypothetical protein